MRSGELASLAGVTVRALRHYHAIGLLAEPPRSENGYRSYGPEDLLRVLRISQLASLGFSLDKIGPMLDELDAERAGDGILSGDAPSAPVDGLLDELDRTLARQIDHLERQRATVARLRQGELSADYPERAARVLDAIDSFERSAHEFGFLLSALTDDDRVAMGIAAHLYSDGELAEIERIFRAIPQRNLTEAYLHVSDLMDRLPSDATPREREAAIEAGMAFLDKISDCFDAANWLRPDKDYERMLDNMAMVHYNDAQIAVSDELFLRFTRRMAEREGAVPREG